MRPRRPGLSLAGVLVLLAGLGSGAFLVVSLGRQVARERERTERSETDEREARIHLDSLRHEARGLRERVESLETERAVRARVVEGELAGLRRSLEEAVRERDSLDGRYGAAAAERDRATEDLLAARNSLEATRNDLARALRRATDAEAAARRLEGEAAEAARRLAAATGRVDALLRPLLQDLRSADGSMRVRAHEALCGYAGRTLPFRPNGTAAEIEADARAIEEAVRPRR